MREFGQRIDLIHELRELTAAKEVPDDGGEGFRIDEFLRRHAFHALIKEGHALFDETLGAGEADAALIGQ